MVGVKEGGRELNISRFPRGEVATRGAPPVDVLRLWCLRFMAWAFLLLKHTPMILIFFLF